MSKYLVRAVEFYARERNYVIQRTGHTEGTVLQKKLSSMAKSNHVSGLSNTLDFCCFGSVQFDYISADEQYTNLINFISEATEPYKSQLVQLVYPIFVQCYIELVFNGKTEDAQKLWHRHNSLFMKADVLYKELVTQLQVLQTSHDVMSHEYFSLFRKNKFALKFSDECFEYLTKYLKKMNHVIILQFLNICFEVLTPETDDQDAGISDDSDDEIVENSNKMSLGTQTIEDQCQKMSSSLELRAMQDAIENVAATVPLSTPSIFLYSLSNTHTVCGADISLNKTYLAGGFEDSSIHVWQLLSSETALYDFPKLYNQVNRHIDKPVVTLRGHCGPVYNVAFSPSVDYLLSCSQDMTVRLWTTANYENMAVYNGHHSAVWDVDISPTSWYFATASCDQTGCVFTTERTTPVSILTGHNAEVNCVKFHTNCNYVATGSSDETVRLWSVQDGRMVRLFHGKQGRIFAVAFSPNGKYIATAGEGQKVKIWDVGSGLLVKDLICQSELIQCLNFNSTGSLLAAAGLENTIWIYDVEKTTDTGDSLKVNHAGNISKSGAVENNSQELLGMPHTPVVTFKVVRFGLKNLLLAFGVQS